MKAVMLGLALVLAMGCGKKSETEPQGQANAPVKPAAPVSKEEPPKSLPKSTPKTSPKTTPKPEPKATDKKTVSVLWEFKTEGRGASSPAVGVDGTVYVGSDDKKVYALDGKTGAKIWEFEGGGAPSSPALGADGILYVSSGSKVYAIQTDSKGLAKSPWPMLGQNPQHTGRAPKK